LAVVVDSIDDTISINIILLVLLFQLTLEFMSLDGVTSAGVVDGDGVEVVVDGIFFIHGTIIIKINLFSSDWQ